MPQTASLWKRLDRARHYFSKPTLAWLVCVVSVVIISLTEPLVPALLKPLLDQGFQKGNLELWAIPLALMGLFAVRGLCAFIGQVALARVANRGLLGLRLEMFQRLLDAHPALFRNQTSSALGNTLVYEVQVGANLLVNALLSLSRDTLTLLALIGYLLFLNWKLSLIVAFLFPAIAWLMKVITKRLYGLTKSNQSATDALAYVVEENALAFREVRLYGAQKAQLERFANLGKLMDRIAMKSTVAGSALTPLTQLMAAAALSAVISVALYQSDQNGTTVGEFVAFVTAMLMLVAPIKHLSEVASPLTRGLAAIERGLDLIENTRIEGTGSFLKERASGHIRFESVVVEFDPDSPPALQHIDLEVQPGESIALVGASGAGKTTLVNLLPRFIDHSSGNIFLDGVNLREWNLATLRSQFAMVSQQVVVLNDTLANNVALGLPMDLNRVQQCLQDANLGSYVAGMGEGIHTMVGHNASQLSGGQRQRLAIARAFYKDAPILILDEATSALDNESERAVQEAMVRLQKGRTTLLIAHRLSTIEHADRIVVMANGKIIESGRHRELLELGGTYAALFKLGSLDKAA
ncbi:MAG: lipid A export permease/ATP-binding protein MsbA [Burkholderiales bacterium]|nr:lipid A export permease/ATP-binding protein MsbA [Burkholderiales bacterium]